MDDSEPEPMMEIQLGMIRGNISLLFDVNNNEDSIKFINLILDGYTNKGFITTIDFLIRYIKKNEFNKMYVSSKEFNIYNSVRMSAYELDYSHRR